MSNPLYTWDAQRRRFIRSDGTAVSSTEVRKWIEALTIAAALAFTMRAQSVVDEKLNPIDWAQDMQEDIVSMHYSTALIAAGGLAAITPEFWLAAQEANNFHLTYFAQFSGGVLSGVTKLDNAFVARNALYAEAGFATYENAVAIREFAAGLELYKRVKEAAPNCDDCIAYANMGWQTRGQLPRIGDSVCRTRCRCHFIFKTGTLEDIGRTSESVFAPLRLAA